MPDTQGLLARLRKARVEAKEPELNARLLLAIMYLEGRWPTVDQIKEQAT